MIRITKIGTVLVLAFLFCSSCADNSIDSVNGTPGIQGKTVRLMLSSSSLQVSGGTSRSVGEGMNVSLGSTEASATRAVTEDKIDNVCVFQFAGSAESSTAVLKSKTYVSDLIDRTLDVSLISSTICFLYVCANVGDITNDYTVDSSTYQDLMNASLSVSSQADFSSLLPMCGASATLNLTTMTGNIDVSLTRLVAKVSFTCNLSSLPTGATFSITNATLRNVPKSVSYVAPATGTLTSTTTVDSYIGTGAIVNETAATTTYVWYMPENLRGTGTSISSWTERISKNAPAYSTYIELTGNYTPVSGGETYEATYVIYLGNATDMNNYDVVRNHSYAVTATIKGINLADERVTTDTNLSAGGLSNCYLASTSNHWYRFTGTTRGNGNTTDYTSTYTGISIMPSVVTDASDAVTIPAAQIADAVIVWETSDGLVSQVQWDSESGCVKFKTGDTTAGNAVIAVRNSSGTILWSWHIWRTTFDLAGLNENHVLQIKTNTNYSWYGTLVGDAAMKERKLVMMDRNLGASGTDWATNKGVNCLHYQFGRKDPLPGGGTVEGSGEVNGDITLYGYGSGTSNGQFTIVGKAKSTTTLQSESCTTAQKTVDYTIQHPEAFIYSNITSGTYTRDNTGYSWIYTATLTSPDWEISNCLWGDNNLANGGVNAGYLDPVPWDGNKTIYDPCPAGWRVAPADAFTGVTHDITNGRSGNSDQGWINIAPANIYNTGWSTGWAFRFGSESTDTSTFSPASGSRDAGSGTLCNVGVYGYDWLSSSGGATSLNGSSLGFTSSIVRVAYESYRAHGFPVRCVQE